MDIENINGKMFKALAWQGEITPVREDLADLKHKIDRVISDDIIRLTTAMKKQETSQI